ncbi:MAG: PAN domain-containing protein [Bacteroidota bacterium]
MRPLVFLLVSGFLADAGTAQPEPVSLNADRYGSDIRSIELPGHIRATGEHNHLACQTACDREQGCMAWTFIKTEKWRTTRCFLKNRVPPLTANDCCISGVHPRAYRISRIEASASRGIDEVRTVRRGYSSGATVLESFSLDFLNGDHKLRRFGVLADTRFARFSFADQDSNDPFAAEALWWQVPSGASGELSGTARQRFVADVPAGPPGHTLVLRGFEVRRADRTDANIRTFGITLDSDARTASIVVSDDMGPDWRGFESTTGWASLLSAIPLDPVGAVLMTKADAIGRINGGWGASGGTVPGRPYAFTMQYAWIPNELILKTEAQSGTERWEERYATERPEGRLAIRSFLFSFQNSDHHLDRLGIDLRQANTPRYRAPVNFRDNNLDDPMQWTVEYARLID